MKKKQGFTIIELLVVIAIIAILTSVGIALMNNAKIKGRDARRMADIGEIQKALNLYYTSTNIFPKITTLTTITGTDALSVILKAEKYLPEAPIDPTYPEYSYSYQSNSSGSDYVLNFCLETDTIPNYSKGCSNSVAP